MAVSKWFAWGFTVLGIGLILIGAYFGLFVVPPDFQQGDAARIMFVHVPAMWLSLFAYAFMVGASLVSFVWRHALADVAAKSAAPIGAAVTALGLMTGSIWGYPTWGTWWEWGDARLVSVLSCSSSISATSRSGRRWTRRRRRRGRRRSCASSAR